MKKDLIVLSISILACSNSVMAAAGLIVCRCSMFEAVAASFVSFSISSLIVIPLVAFISDD